MTERVAWSGPTVDGFGAISPDGRLLTYVDWNSTGNLMVHDFETGADRRLTGKSSWGEPGDASFSTISKTGTQVAYAWNEHNVCELRIASLEGTGIPESRKVFTNDDIENISPFDWSPDGRWIAAHLRRKDKSGEIALIAASDGTRRALKSTDWRGPTKIFFSPDGRFVAYNLAASASESPTERDVFVMTVDATREVPVITHPGQNVVMGWSPDGTQLLVGSDRAGSMGLWAVPMAMERRTARPRFEIEFRHVLVARRDDAGNSLHLEGRRRFVREGECRRLEGGDARSLDDQVRGVRQVTRASRLVS